MIEFIYLGWGLTVFAIVLDVIALLQTRGLTRFLFFMFSIIILFAALPYYGAAAQAAAEAGRAAFNAVVMGGVYFTYITLALNIIFAIYTIAMAAFD